MLPIFIGSDIYRLPVFKPPHPLAVPRAMLVADLVRALGWLGEEQYSDSPMATVAELARFHEADYVAALVQAEAAQDLPEAMRAQYRIGADANVIHPAVFRRPAISAGGAMLAARLTARGGVVQAPGVGSHHGRPGRASGFCFVNDVVLGIMQWQALGVRRVVYLDLDAHHGDGVEAAFAAAPDVLTISVHEAGRWPRSGETSFPAQGILNFAVPAGFNDSELEFLMEARILPAILAHAPEAIWLLPGADALAGDPMAKLQLSNQAIWEVVRRRLQPVSAGAVLGGDLGDPERYPDTRDAAAGGGSGAVWDCVFPRRGAQSAGALAAHALRCHDPRRRAGCGAEIWRTGGAGGMRRMIFAAWVLLALAGGVARADDDPTGPQPKLPAEQLTIVSDDGKSHVFTVEVAVTQQQQDTGLMFRTEVPANTGMLFPWPAPQISEMWMKNTIQPLDMVFIGADGTVKAIAENTVPYSLRVISSGVPVLATLELQAGITAALDINVGDRVIAKQFGGG
jgi:acetoin utilization protein AcuC